ncbi:MAG: hypothetical protein L0H36_01120 [bacterium]|nr:hypothetical protein [bacterium]
MPELPEVETVRRGLNKLIVGLKIKQVSSDNPRSFPNSENDVRLFLVGASIKAVRRRAKVLMIDLSTNYTLVIHLKMTGQLVFVSHHSDRSASSASHADAPHTGATVESGRSNDGLVESTAAKNMSQGVMVGGVAPTFTDIPKDDERKVGANRPAGPASTETDVQRDEQKNATVSANETRFGAGHPNDSLIGKLPDKSTRVKINFSDEANLFFNDQRKFGWMKLMPTAEVSNIDFMRKVGPEPLESNFSPEQFQQRFLRRARTTIKAALLDQTVIAGIGNIYADESLWMSQVHPSRLVGSITDKEFDSLYHSVRDVMSLSIEKGGSTDRNYVDAEGKRGSYMDFANVFRREGQACSRCGNEIIKTRVAGRGTHICPICQVL